MVRRLVGSRFHAFSAKLLLWLLVVSALLQFSWVSFRVYEHDEGLQRGHVSARRGGTTAASGLSSRLPTIISRDRKSSSGHRGTWQHKIAKKRNQTDRQLLLEDERNIKEIHRKVKQDRVRQKSGESAPLLRPEPHSVINQSSPLQAKDNNFPLPHEWNSAGMTKSKTVVHLEVQLPIFVASLPKSGTTSIWQYFNCGGHQASHQWIKILNGTISSTSIQTGQCIRRNVQAKQAPFQGCGGVDIFTDTGFANYNKKDGGGGGVSDCYYPSVDALDSIYEHYPQSTIILIVRNTTQWYRSMKKWGEGSLLDRWRPCNATGFPSFAAKARDFKAFYEWHTDNLRNFAARHPSINYIELSLESPANGKLLEDKIGIPAHCWRKCLPTIKSCQPVLSLPKGNRSSEN